MKIQATRARDLARAFGYLHREEVLFLEELMNMLPEEPVIVNIGAGAGTSSLLFAEIRPLAKRYSVDISPGGPLGGFEGERNAFIGSGLTIPIQILGDSYKVGISWENEPIDFLFVDGDHSDNSVRRDITAWLPHMKMDGVVAFHDYSATVWPGVKAVVDEMMAGHTTIKQVDTVIAFRLAFRFVAKANR